ncbi:hypothetical protein RYX36_003210 [Vicia faba]
MGLRLLMKSVQNSIEESWRRIPSVIALFAAEASCVLLESSHDHYAAICTFLTQSSTMNMKELLPSVVSALCLLTFGASNLQVGRTILLQDYNTIISSNSLRVRCPLEANPDWRWSFYQPRKDQSLEFTGTGTENMAEYHACQTLLVVVANVLGGKKLESSCLSPLDVEISSLIKWERSLLRN